MPSLGIPQLTRVSLLLTYPNNMKFDEIYEIFLSVSLPRERCAMQFACVQGFFFEFFSKIVRDFFSAEEYFYFYEHLHVKCCSRVVCNGLETNMIHN